MILGIGGEPATGKSELVREWIKYRGNGNSRKGIDLYYSVFGSTALFGIYDGKPYPGTDRLSTRVQSEAIRFVQSVGTPGTDFDNLLFEGDRLFNRSFLDACIETGQPCRFLILEASDADKASRRALRADTKSPVFLKGRATKYRNLADHPAVSVVQNNTPEDRTKILKLINESLSSETYRVTEPGAVSCG